MCRFPLSRKFCFSTQRTVFTEHWKNEKQKVKQKGLEFSYNLEDDLWVYALGREERRKEGRKEGRKGRLKCGEEPGTGVRMLLLWTHCELPGMFITCSPSVPSSSSPLSSQGCWWDWKESVKIKNGVPVEFNKSLQESVILENLVILWSILLS